MTDEKKAKKQAKINALRCPKCSHSVGDHRRTYSYSIFFMMDESSGNAKLACHGKVESNDEKGFVRLGACDCDLKPEEAAVNAIRGVKAAPLDANGLLRELAK